MRTMDNRKKREQFLERIVYPAIAHHLDQDYLLRMSDTRSCVNRLVRRMVSELRVEGIDALAERKHEAALHGETIKYAYFVTHRSELDYILLQAELSKRGIPAVIATGDNLINLPVIGEFFRRCGAHGVIRSQDSVVVRTSFGQGTDVEQRVQLSSFDKVLLADNYFENVMLNEKWDYIIFPEKMRSQNGTSKYGRSYDGSLLPFDTRLMSSLARLSAPLAQKDAQEDARTYRKLCIEMVPVHITYERVPEDANFARLANMRWASPTVKYLWDFFYVGVLVPFTQNRFRATVKAGNPVPSPESRNKAGIERASAELRDRVGALCTPYETQIVCAALTERINKDSLYERIYSVYKQLAEQGVDLSNISDPNPRAVYRKSLTQFHAHWRNIISEQSGDVRIRRPDVISQYRNHIAHFLNTENV